MKQGEARRVLGGLSSILVGDPDAYIVVVMLHGRMMQATDLAPFADALGAGCCCVFPDAPLAAEPRGRTWWPVDSEARLRRLHAGPMDLSSMDPPGRVQARAQLDALLAELGPRRRVLVGFSQGGMLAMDYVLHGGKVDALALLSSTRIAFADWQPRLGCLAGLPMLVAHGRQDDELSFAAGEGLRDAAIHGGAAVTWLPFEGGHEIPMLVWRALRQFLRQL